MKFAGGAAQRPGIFALLRGQLRNIAGFGVSVACIAFMAWRIDFHQVGAAIVSFKWPYLLVGLLALSSDYGVRILRWSIMLRAAGAPSSFSRCVAPFLGSIALNNVLPARLGDVIRALVFPTALGITKTASTGSLVLERLVDLATLLCFLTAALLYFPDAAVPESVKFSATTLAVLTFVGLVSVVLFSGLFSQILLRWSDRDFGKRTLLVTRTLLAVSSLLSSFKMMSRAPVLLTIFALSVLVWGGEAGLFWAFLVGFGIAASPAAAILVMAIATLATLVPSSPGYVGPFHLAAFTAISILGGSPEVAASFAVLVHAGIWLPTTFAGAVSILMNPSLFRRRVGKSTLPSSDRSDI
jgi:uncharacterized protein (TIRG00374 family)